MYTQEKFNLILYLYMCNYIQPYLMCLLNHLSFFLFLHPQRLSQWDSQRFSMLMKIVFNAFALLFASYSSVSIAFNHFFCFASCQTSLRKNYEILKEFKDFRKQNIFDMFVAWIRYWFWYLKRFRLIMNISWNVYKGWNKDKLRLS